jgi:acetyl-CoA synthetase
VALDILRLCRGRLAPYKRIRRIEFAPLPKTISGKIRRVELRANETSQRDADSRGPGEYWYEDFPELRGKQ